MSVNEKVWRTDPPPQDGTPIYMRVIQPYRFLPYKPNSQQFKRGEKGRWQMMNEYGGWDNCPHPIGNEWSIENPFSVASPIATGWQPIDGAPRHYKPILACDAIKGYEAIVVHNGAEWELLSHDSFPMGVGFYPTHWMPLPTPPVSMAQGGES